MNKSRDRLVYAIIIVITFIGWFVLRSKKELIMIGIEHSFPGAGNTFRQMEALFVISCPIALVLTYFLITEEINERKEHKMYYTRLSGREVVYDGNKKGILQKTKDEATAIDTPYNIQDKNKNIVMWIPLGVVRAAYKGEKTFFYFVDTDSKKMTNFLSNKRRVE